MCVLVYIQPHFVKAFNQIQQIYYRFFRLKIMCRRSSCCAHGSIQNLIPFFRYKPRKCCYIIEIDQYMRKTLTFIDRFSSFFPFEGQVSQI